MQEEIARIINTHTQDDRRLIREISILAEEHGNVVYREVLQHLVGKVFDSEMARRYWDDALSHRERILVRERVETSLRPALLDYLHQVVRELDDPRIVEATDLASIRNASIRDGLTGLYNQTYFKEFVGKICNQRHHDSSANCAILLLDLDHFKQYNDRCGHLAGDRALKRAADLILKSIRKGDIAARYGGEEFAVLLGRITRDQAFAVAERIRMAIEKEDFPDQHLMERANLTVSGGLAFMDDQRELPEKDKLINRADQELYRAKLFRNAISPHQSENRKTARMYRKSIVEFALLDENKFFPAMSHNVSPFGIALDVDRKLEPGTTVKLRFRHPFWPSNRQVLATVKHIDEIQTGGLFRLGLKFNPEQALSHRDNLLQETG